MLSVHLVKSVNYGVLHTGLEDDLHMSFEASRDDWSISRCVEIEAFIWLLVSTIYIMLWENVLIKNQVGIFKGVMGLTLSWPSFSHVELKDFPKFKLTQR